MIAHLVMLLLSVTTIRSTHHGVQTGFGKAGYDPNKMICVSRDVTGSRLQTERECHTAQQWEDQKLQEQVGLSRKQYNGDPGCNGGGTCNPLRARDTPW